MKVEKAHRISWSALTTTTRKANKINKTLTSFISSSFSLYGFLLLLLLANSFFFLKREKSQEEEEEGKRKRISRCVCDATRKAPRVAQAVAIDPKADQGSVRDGLGAATDQGHDR